MSDRSAAPGSILALPLISIVLSVIVGSLVIIFSQWLVTGTLAPGLALDAYGALISGSVGSERAIVNTLNNTMPLLLGGLAVGLGFKAGLFNIGVQGQFLMGALGSVIVGVQLRGRARSIVAVPVSLVAGHDLRRRVGLHPGLPEGRLGRPRSRHHDHAQLRRHRRSWRRRSAAR